ncbi:hypothetical protein KBC55_02800 [Patescibacteria group bacterium]|nr:hypothetical protein [Patescibacteria group bacterium]
MDTQRPIKFVTLKHRAVVFGITVLGVGLLGGIGYILDWQFETRPLFLIIGVILSFPLVQLAIVRQLRVK